MTSGIILLDKPPGQTSFQTLGVVKRRLGTTRVGHAGTLDRFAEGLLVVLTGRLTRLCAFATDLDKEYEAAVTFGAGTDTLDPEGAVTGTGTVPGEGDLAAVLPEFLGTTLQVPPAYSAVHVGGRRAYQAARAGDTVEMAPRQVTITALDLLRYEPPVARLRVACSKGTYIRALARDIAERMGTCAHVSALRRTRIGGFSLSDARRPEEFDPGRDLLPGSRFFEAACGSGLGRVSVQDGALRAVTHGAKFSTGFLLQVPVADGTYGAFSASGDLVAILRRREGSWSYAAVLGGAE